MENFILSGTFVLERIVLLFSGLIFAVLEAILFMIYLIVFVLMSLVAVAMSLIGSGRHHHE